MPAFSHLDAGTSERVWQDDERMPRLPSWAEPVDHLVVVAAHPDDETLGAGGLMRTVHRAGGRVTVVVATDGDRSHPDSPTHTPARLAALRRAEVTAAVQHLAPGATLVFAGLPDGGLEDRRDDLAARVAAELEVRGDHGGDRAVVAAPWSGDGHRDHRIVAEVVSDVCAGRAALHLGYPIWLWHWGAPDDLPWESARGVRLDADARGAKAAALALHVSQTEPLSDAPGDEPILHDRALEHFDRDVEVFVVEGEYAHGAGRNSPGDATLTGEYFEQFFGRHDDPWGFDSRWYEQRKRSVLLAALPTRGLGRVLEIGCATGALTAELASRADSVLAVDVAQAAVDRARARLAGEPHGERVTVTRLDVPGQWPSGTFDTIVLSEVGYYLSDDDLAAAIARMDGALAADGVVVACHWRHPVADYPRSGDSVHRALRAHPGWGVSVSHLERDFVLEVFERSPVSSVAEREGLA
ncbi:bifunctional PIG-L family deacetylase/class I SAM-dependent methyltransferase [Microbacterium sp. ARD31]|uniref:bifunctional PIG-L family deacetylase/class I SAM-dependent methyltransferase n=1 Tax=Microbacterium sp. ARD31 TaxID=2962576 RepID=UPI002880FFED|nr:bifunctional PIG-L family deacetylase/class I SAM-dependent methyltransferase [Microbacterium sp. ARD31]MDT0183057.1 bifunctional PIG-L family deacetylase/class I SAM-dependent methyltransferase [Microbacterium sp. ARD31]